MNTRAARYRVLRLVVNVLLIVWAGFWAWFVLSATLGDAQPVPWWIPTAWLSSLATLVLLGWRWPALGGAALVASGVWAAWYFANPGARTLLAAPAIVLGVASWVSSRGARRSIAAVLLLCCAQPAACASAQDPTDLPFRTSSIRRHENGALMRAHLVEPAEIGGFACQRWCWWYEDGRIDNVELARDTVVSDHVFPAGTRVFFDADGALAHAWLSADAVIDGRSCRGGLKIDTAFHPNGRVRAFFPRDPIEIDGVLCAASVFHPVYLHANGRLRQCKLARDVTLGERVFKRGTVLTLDEEGAHSP